MADKRPNNVDETPNAKRPRFKPQESTAGISQYFSEEKRKPFAAKLKLRSFDFIVKEIDPSGKVVELTTFENPVKDDDTGTKGLDDELRQQLDEAVSNEDIKANVKVDVTSMNKEQRTLIHVSIRNGYPSLQSETVDEGETKFIVITKKVAHKGERLRYYWPNGRPSYTTFVLHKDNIDTMEAINTIAGLTRVKPSVFSYAGTKDKRAITTQRVSVYRMKPDYLLGINKRHENFKIGNVHFGEKQLQLGDLTGNRFILTLRDVTGGTKEEIEQALEKLREGFINYFGLQRFGTTSIPTHDIGKKMLAEKWSDACDLILKPRDGGRPRKDLDAARAMWMETKDAAKCLDLLTTRGSQNSLEGQLLTALKKDPGHFQSALFGIQKNTRLLYIHAYQSYVWNSVVSKRIEKYGRKVIIGDLVLKPGTNEDGDRAPVEIVTEETLSKYEIWDVVLPLPGFAIKYPENEQHQWFVDIVKEDGFEDLKCFESRNRAFSMRGNYRKVFCLPTDFSYEIKSYTDSSLPLVKSDWDAMLEKDENLRNIEDKKIKIKHERRERENAQKVNNGETPHQPRPKQSFDSPDEPKLGVVLSFSLLAASYATMVLREFLRTDSEVTDERPTVDDEDETVDDE